MSGPIPRVSRDDTERLGRIVGATRFRPARVRPVAHLLTLLGWSKDGPTYSVECRADARDLGKACAAWIRCECPSALSPQFDEEMICPDSPTKRHQFGPGGPLIRPAYGCVFANDAIHDAEEVDDVIRELVGKHELRRGQFLIEFGGGIDDEVEVTLLGEIRNVVGSLPVPEAVSVEPTKASRYPGYGPEVELRELIEAALSEEGADAVVWDEDYNVVTVDANAAAKAALAWFEQRYDIPPDQQTLPLAGGRPIPPTPPPLTTSRISTVDIPGGRL